MRFIFLLSAITCLCSVGTESVCRAADEKKQDLPRVLILGDSVYRQPAADMAKELKGRVEVVFAQTDTSQPFNSTTVLSRLDKLLGDKPWDVIHFNVGLGDLIHRVPGLKSFRILPKHAGGVPATDADQYRKNLEALVTRLQATQAQLIWGSTTPIQKSTTGILVPGSEIRFNEIAAEVMAARKIPVNDMHAYVTETIDLTRSGDPFSFNRQPLHPPLVNAVQQQLKQSRRNTVPATNGR